jgi:CRISPR type I-E-associated protein CasB/Cse2
LVEEGRSLGEALFAAGVAEHRVLRLLRAEGDDLVPLLRHTIHQLSSTGESTCPIELTKLVLATGSRAESIRRKIARHYYAVAEGVAR